jgi:uncharacterized delta-60 repeat protein
MSSYSSAFRPGQGFIEKNIKFERIEYIDSGFILISSDYSYPFSGSKQLLIQYSLPDIGEGSYFTWNGFGAADTVISPSNKIFQINTEYNPTKFTLQVRNFDGTGDNEIFISHNGSFLRNFDGKYDNNFYSSNNGLIKTLIGDRSEAKRLILQPDGKIVLAGVSYRAEEGFNIAVVRYESDGELDRTFNNNGLVEIDHTYEVGDPSSAKLVAQQTGGFKTIYSKYTTESFLDESVFEVFAIENSKLLVVGSVQDQPVFITIDKNGLILSDIKISYSIFKNINQSWLNWIKQDDGKLIAVAGGYTDNGLGSELQLTRFFQDGSVDKSFGKGGFVSWKPGVYTYPVDSLLQPDGGLIIAVRSLDESGRLSLIGNHLLRFTSEGIIDIEFGQNGILTLPWDSIASLALEPNGNILVLGQLNSTSNTSIVARYQPNGQLDSSFQENFKHINNAPTVSKELDTLIVDEDESFSIYIPSDTFVDANITDTLTYKIQLGDGRDLSKLSWPIFFDPMALRFFSDSGISVPGSWNFLVTATDNQGESTSTKFNILVNNVNDKPTGEVWIRGFLGERQLLEANHSEIKDNDGLFGPISYKWFADGQEIDGAIDKTFVLTQAQVGKSISLIVSYVDGWGTTENVESNSSHPLGTGTGKVLNLNDLPTGSVTITGTAIQGQALTASNDLADVDGLDGDGEVAYQWQAGGEDIDGATNATYTLTQAEVGKVITVVASYTDGQGTDESVTSDATSTVISLAVTDTDVEDASPAYLNLTLQSNGGQPGAATIELMYDHALSTADLPFADSFSVNINGTQNAVTSVEVDGYKIILKLSDAVSTGAVTVAVSYTDPTSGNDTYAIQGLSGLDASSFAITSGVVADGYIRGAQMYLDAPNGLQILGGVVTDANGNFFIPSGSNPNNYVLVAVGGVNIDTGIPNTANLKAPAGASVINPLTTLVAEVMSSTGETNAAAAATKVATALGLSSSLGANSLLSYDPLSSESVANTLIQKASAQVATIVAIVAANETGSGSANAVVSNLATAISNAATSSSTINLADSAVLTEVLSGIVLSSETQSLISDATSAIEVAESVVAISRAQGQFLDTIAPNAPYTITAPALTNDTSPTVRVGLNVSPTDGSAAVVGDRVILLADGVEVGAVSVNLSAILNGYVDITSNTLAEGIYSLRAQIVDQSGNIGQASTATTLTIDTSNPSASIVDINDSPTGSVTISGTATQGQVLIASNDLADADVLGLIAYQWRANGELAEQSPLRQVIKMVRALLKL